MRILLESGLIPGLKWIRVRDIVMLLHSAPVEVHQQLFFCKYVEYESLAVCGTVHLERYQEQDQDQDMCILATWAEITWVTLCNTTHIICIIL